LIIIIHLCPRNSVRRTRFPVAAILVSSPPVVSEILELITAKLKVVEIARLKKSCRRCEKIAQPPAPSRPIPRSMVGPGLLAHILASKFDDHNMRLLIAWIRLLFALLVAIILDRTPKNPVEHQLAIAA